MTTQHYIEGYRRDLENEFTNSDTSGENQAEDDYYNKAREYFCAKHTGFSSFLFCLQQVTPTPANQQIVPPVPQAPPPPQGPPPLTPEQQQQQAIIAQQQAIMAQLTYTTPSGFIAENPGIIIGGAVLLLSALCFMAACAMSFLTAKSQKPAVPVKRGNQIRKPARHVHKKRKRASSSMDKMEKGQKKKEDGGRKEEKPSNSSYSKSKGKSAKSVDSTS
ncbi:Protein CBG25923 [Caenorhabditis briggsae]|uniref:Protein CBG25923 n=1 Tax=Caenorhabditis briggsae TaxID=6238 RepID=B6IK55_CAEBR|nr:Protein CBG25923 [Caenorhabditis briggsae]CAS00285.1 Protein CBG25923 [Caenorhabditis briggsae]